MTVREQPGRGAYIPPAALSRRAGLALIVSLILAIAASDMLLAHFYNLGALYTVPLIVATQYVRHSSRLLLLAAFLIALNYAGLLVAYLPDLAADAHLRYRLINRTFVAAALGGSAVLVTGYLRVRDYWLRWQVNRATTDTEVSFVLQVFQLFEDIAAVLVAVCLAAVTFTVDLAKPQTINLPILYLIPLAVVAITRSRWLLWASVPALLACTFAGYFLGARANVPPDIAHRTLVNRELAALAIVLSAILFQLASSAARRAVTTAPPSVRADEAA